jgi:hypothetical protein
VTGTGPLAGTTIDSHGHRTTVPRFHFSLESVTQLHADIGWFIGALAVALVIGLRFAGGSPRTVRLGWIVLVGLGLQGVIGYAQYFNHLPAGLVWVHVSTSVTVWIFVLQLYLSTGTCLPPLAKQAAVPGTGQAASAAEPPPVKTTILRLCSSGMVAFEGRSVSPGQGVGGWGSSWSVLLVNAWESRCPGARGTLGR